MGAIPFQVQSQYSTTVGTTSTVSLTTSALPKATTVGNVMFLMVAIGDIDYGSGSALTLSLSTSGWTQKILNTQVYSGVGLWAKTVTSGDTGVVSLSVTGGGTGDRLDISAMVIEVAGANTTSPCAAVSATNSGGSSISASVTPLNPGSFSYVFCMDAGTFTSHSITNMALVNGTQFNTDYGSSNTSMFYAMQSVPYNTSSQTYSFSLTGSVYGDDVYMCAFAINPATPLTVVQSEITSASFASATSFSKALNSLPSATTIGNLLVMEVSDNSGGSFGATMSTPSGWSVFSSQTGSFNYVHNYLLYKTASSTSDGAPTLSFSSSFAGILDIQVRVTEYANASGIYAYANMSQSGISGNITSTTVTPAFTGALPVLFATQHGTTAFTVPTAYTSDSGTAQGSSYSLFCHATNLNLATSDSVTLSMPQYSAGIHYFIQPTSPLQYYESQSQVTAPQTLLPTIVDANTSWGTTASGTTGRSLTSGYWYTGEPLTIGNYMVAFITVTSNNHALSSFGLPTGWTLITSASDGNYAYIYAMYKQITSPSEYGLFTATINSATAQALDYVINVFEVANISGAFDFGSKTSGAANMSITMTASVSGSLALCAFVDTADDSPTFSGTGVTWVNSGNPPLGHGQTGGAIGCYSAFQLGDTLAPNTSKTYIASTGSRSHPCFLNILCSPYVITGFYDSLASTYSAAGSTNTYTESQSATASSFNSSQAQHLVAKNGPTETMGFSETHSVVQHVHTSKSDTVTTFGTSQANHVKKNVNRSDTFADYSESISQVLKAEVNLSQVDSFEDSLIHNINAHSAASDIASNYSDSTSQVVSAHTNASDLGSSFSDSLDSNISAISSPSDGVVERLRFCDTELIKFS